MSAPQKEHLSGVSDLPQCGHIANRDSTVSPHHGHDTELTLLSLVFGLHILNGASVGLFIPTAFGLPFSIRSVDMVFFAVISRYCAI